MKRLSLVIFPLIMVLISGCTSNNLIDQKLFPGDWISQTDNRLIFAEDCMLVQNIIYNSIPPVKYKISHDTLNIFTKDFDYDDYRKPRDLVWKYRILHLDSARLSIVRIFPVKKTYPDEKDSLSFFRSNTKKMNDLELTGMELSTHGCYGPCPVLDIKVTCDSILFISGYRYSNLMGLNFFKLNKKEYTRIVAKLNAMPRENIHFDTPFPDAPLYSIYLRSGNDSIIREGCIMSVNPSLSNFIFYMKSLGYLLDMKQCTNSSISFRDKRNSRLYSSLKVQ